MQTVIDNILVNYEIQGRENKRTVVILHGWGQNLLYWQNLAKLLSQKLKVISLDLPGFGSSSIPTTFFDTNDYANLVEKFIKKIEITNIILLGHSFGGKIAIKIASSSNLVEKLFLVSPSGIGPKPFSVKLKILISKILKSPVFWLPSKIKLFFFKKFASIDYYNSGEMKGIFKKIINENFENYAAKITIPTIIIWGENDQELSPKNGKLLRSLINDSILRIVWKSGHSPNIESHEKLANLLLEYI